MPPFWQRPATHRPGVPKIRKKKKRSVKTSCEFIIIKSPLPTISQLGPEKPNAKEMSNLIDFSMVEMNFYR